MTASGIAVAPGRVNLIGEHTDYNDGFVLPVALDRRVSVAFRGCDDRVLRVHTTKGDASREIDLDALEAYRGGGWASYVAGVAWAMREAGRTVQGADLSISSTLPSGAGLSSSAALEVAVHRALTAVAGGQWDAVEAATLARRAENDFVGVACGVMDQMAAARSRAGQAMLLDCRSLEIEYVPIPPDATIVVIDTGVRRKLSSSAYNERRATCDRVVSRLRMAGAPITALRDVNMGQLVAAESGLDATDFRRAVHVVGENARVLAAVKALRAGRLHDVGALLSASHASLRDLYEVSSPELDVAVRCAEEDRACFGARMTGAGFGGCAVALVASAGAAAFVDALRERLAIRLPACGEVTVVLASHGAGLEQQL